jgi:hypothetical protein
LTNTYGEKWYLKYGFKQEEVPEAGLSLAAKESLENIIKLKMEKDEL